MSSVELRRRVAPEWQISAFFDTGAGWIDRAPTPSAIHNRRRLSGAGFGAAHVRPGGLSWNVTVAWRTAQAPTSDRDRMPRLWTSLSQAL
jgi:hemolysin activation/secretion protein